MRYLTIIFLFLATFASAQQQMFLRSTPAAGVTGILDSYTGSAAAYATALLYSSYGGSCLRVRRDSDNAEQDIGFSGQDIDEAAINSFCSGANCFVKTWYDQSGNGYNATQTTTTKQPQIVSSGAIIRDGAITAIQFDGTSDGMRVDPVFSNSTTVYFLFVCNTSDNGYVLFSNGATNAPINYIAWDNQSGSASIGSTTYIDGAVASIGDSRNTLHDLTTGQQRLVYTGPISLSSHTKIGISEYTAAGLLFSGKIQCMVFYPSDQSANRTGIETAINNYYNIYP